MKEKNTVFLKQILLILLVVSTYSYTFKLPYYTSSQSSSSQSNQQRYSSSSNELNKKPTFKINKINNQKTDANLKKTQKPMSNSPKKQDNNQQILFQGSIQDNQNTPQQSYYSSKNRYNSQQNPQSFYYSSSYFNQPSQYYTSYNTPSYHPHQQLLNQIDRFRQTLTSGIKNQLYSSQQQSFQPLQNLRNIGAVNYGQYLRQKILNDPQYSYFNNKFTNPNQYYQQRQSTYYPNQYNNYQYVPQYVPQYQTPYSYQQTYPYQKNYNLFQSYTQPFNYQSNSKNTAQSMFPQIKHTAKNVYVPSKISAMPQISPEYDTNQVNGKSNIYSGQLNKIKGDTNQIKGYLNTAIGNDNKIQGENNVVIGDGNVIE